MEAIIAAVISGAVTLLGVLIANGKNQAVRRAKSDNVIKAAKVAKDIGGGNQSRVRRQFCLQIIDDVPRNEAGVDTFSLSTF